jgi:DNA polymerase phi
MAKFWLGQLGSSSKYAPNALVISFKLQVFRVFCDDITETGLLDMLRVVKINLKGRGQTDSDDEDDGRVDIEEDDETIMEDAEVGETDDADDLDEDTEDDSTDEDDGPKAVANKAKDGDKAEATKDEDDSDDSDGMDDDAMFRIDPYIARIFKERNLPGSESKQAQLMRFKLRVLTLLDIYLQRNPGIFQLAIPTAFFSLDVDRR